MKLRIRHKSKTKVLTLDNGLDCTVGDVRRRIQDILSDLSVAVDAKFELSLNGQTSLGSDSVKLIEVGVVSGDLVKLIMTEEGNVASQYAEVSEAMMSEVNLTSTQSMMSVIEEQPSTSQPEPENTETERSENEQVVPDPPCDDNSGPMFLRDYINEKTLPIFLQDLYDLPAVQNEFHAICVAFHTLMLESGFVLQNATQQSSDISTALMSFVVSLDYNHPAAETLQFSTTYNPLGPFVLINGLVRPCLNMEEQVLTLQVKSAEFVKKFNADTKPADSSTIYRNMSKLSHIFKEGIAYKALNNMREELKLPPLHGLLSLFPELLLRVFSSLDAKSLCAVAQTCSQLYNIAGEDILWKKLYIQDFASRPNSVSDSWKDTYRVRYLEKNKEERERRQFLQREREFEVVYPPLHNPYPDLPVPFPGQPTGMIGGDYDLDPAFPYGPFGGRGRGQPNPLGPMRGPRLPGSGNPLPGSRYDPMNPFGGGFRPGRGGGMFDDDDLGPGTGLPQLPGQRGRRGFGGGGFGGFI
ncbi:unnamed protein product [Clavelina lepadiformis]|uniref:ubiquitinyl hydrolase 1 n=1 Tax=Clavelina lepadiformis TaxID=159417 RepID=A0ABP0GCM6_CLALP